MNRINQIFLTKEKLLSIYFTAGYPNLNDTIPILKKLQEAGVDIIEIGLPFSDPLADGPTIQESSKIALNNGMNSEKLFNQLKNVRNEIEEYIKKNEDYKTELGYAVRIDKFADSSIDMYIRCFTKTDKWEEWLAVKERLAIQIKQIVEKNGASFAFPSQSIYVEKK